MNPTLSEAMTVRDLIDLTTYLHSLGAQDPGVSRIRDLASAASEARR
jgi:hypothetical protein